LTVALLSPQGVQGEDLSVAIYEGGSAAAGWLGAGFDYPPNPCALVDG